MSEPVPVAIRALDVAEAERRETELVDLLVDAVVGGASVNFLAGFTQGEARTFWRKLLPDLGAGSVRLLVADTGLQLVGTVLLSLMQQPNQPHRARNR